jgi:hypothetical protein
MFEVMDQVVVSEDRDMLRLYLWRRSTAVFVAYNTVGGWKTDAVRGMAGLDM